MEYTKQQKRNYSRKIEKYKQIKIYNEKKKKMLIRAKEIQYKENLDNLKRLEWRKLNPKV